MKKIFSKLCLVLSLVFASSAFGANYTFDSFTGTNGTLLTAHTGETGATWTNYGGTNATTINSNRLYWNASSGYGQWHASGTSATASKDITIVVYLPTISANEMLIGDNISGGNSGNGYYIDINTATVNISKDQGASTLATAPGTLSAATNYTIRLSLTNGHQKLYINGVLVASSTDSTYTMSTSGVVALLHSGVASTGSGVHIDSLTAGLVEDPGVTSASATGTTTTTVSNTAATGDSGTYTAQYQRAPDSSGSPGTFANVGSAQSGIALGTAPTNLSDTGLTANTKYWYRVQQTYSFDSSVVTSAAVSVTTNSSFTPGTTSASATGSSTATVSNTAASTGTAPYSYQYQRAPDSSGSPGTFANVGSAQGGLGSGTAPSNLSDTGLTASTKYWYRVSVTDSASSNATSTPVSITTSASIPTITSATANANGTQVDLVFSQSVTGVSASDFNVIIGGFPVVLSGVSGSGTNWSLLFAVGNWAYSGQSVSVGYLGSGVSTLVHATITGTNSSALVNRQTIQQSRGFGAFIHFSGATFGMSLPGNQADANSKFNPTSLNIDQWLDTAQAMGARYTVLTTKHDCSFCMWPTTSGAPNIAPTPWYASTPIDIVGTYVTKARARGLGVGLYLNFYDPWFTGTRTGHDGTYGTGTTYLTYISQQITELLSNYGQIDELWVDSWVESNGPGYTLVPYATILALVHSLQPNCILINNDHALTLGHSEIVCLEADTGGDSIPSNGNLLPSEYAQTCRTDNNWTWASGSSFNASFKDIYTLAASYNTMRSVRCNYLLNIPPDNTGVMPTAQVTWCTQLGAIMGTKGGAVLPVPGNVKSGVDRGDLIPGSLTSARAFAF